ncbi:TIGR02679 family protein [Protofrankia coriariae]|uniref:TIGR02679 family protein n=1 Tax=Protofrankia coriariae TaxID=1562887 RepID=UPI0022856A2B|nr:TIGR02679 family protein [Protofrankia coriariae]
MTCGNGCARSPSSPPNPRCWPGPRTSGGRASSTVRWTRRARCSTRRCASWPGCRRTAADGQPLPAFADAVVGRTHALDDGTRLSTLVLRALAAIYGVAPPAGADERRALWERAGVASDALSAQVLVAGLRPVGDDPLSRALRLWAEAGQASVVTLAQVRACPGLRVVARRVWVVENPSLVTMAITRFGVACPPLVCTAGWPSSAAITLLRQLAASDADLRYHGDFDGDGLRIAAHVMTRTGARPWRMAAADYLAAVAAMPSEAVRADAVPAAADHPAAAAPAGSTGVARPGHVTDAPWDQDLAAALRARDIAVPEERLADILLADLAGDVRAGDGRSHRSHDLHGDSRAGGPVALAEAPD